MAAARHDLDAAQCLLQAGFLPQALQLTNQTLGKAWKGLFLAAGLTDPTGQKPAQLLEGLLANETALNGALAVRREALLRLMRHYTEIEALAGALRFPRLADGKLLAATAELRAVQVVHALTHARETVGLCDKLVPA